MDSERVWVVGGGIVGIVVCWLRARAGLRTVLVERDPQRRAAIRQAWREDALDRLYGEPGLIVNSAAAEHLQFADDLEVLHASRVSAVVICVGTADPDGRLDAGPAIDAVGEVRAALSEDQDPVIVVRSTVNLEAVPALRMAAERRRIAIVPEFLVESRAADAADASEVVIGLDQHHADRQHLASLVRDAVGMLSAMQSMVTPEEAVLIKLGRNFMLHQRASFAADIATVAERTPWVDASRVLAEIGRDPRIGDRYLAIGLGPGGSCLDKDAGALQSTFEATRRPDATKRRAASLARLTLAAWREAASRDVYGCVMVWGVGFKPDTRSRRNSPVRWLLEELPDLGLAVIDPGHSLGDDTLVDWGHMLLTPADRPVASVAIALHRSAAEPDWCDRVLPGGVVLDPYRLLDPARVVDRGRDLWVGGVGYDQWTGDPIRPDPRVSR